MQNLVRRLAPIMIGLPVLIMVSGLAWGVVSLPAESSGLTKQVSENISQAGASHPVTAVLLNFRGYDTLLEITVLLLAVLGTRSLTTRETADLVSADSEPGPVLVEFLGLLAPVIVLVAGYLLWVGGHAPGGAFQAGAVLAALGVLLLLGGVHWRKRVPDWLERILLSLGVLVFAGIALGVIATEGRLLEYPPRQAKWMILAIEAACTLSIAAVLALLFVAVESRPAVRIQAIQPKERDQ